MKRDTTYCGRFAPSPTGPLHFGSLVAAVGSYLEARTRQGRWLVRMEDLDPPREIPGAADLILKNLDCYGFEWDGAVLRQSQRHDAYEAAMSKLKQAGMLYPCACTRREIADFALQGIEGPVYPGTCRNGLHGREPRAWRVRTHPEKITYEDALQGKQTQRLENDIGDFVLKRADGYFAYQLAVVVDDAEQGITHVVRGADLLDSAPRQLWLQRLLGVDSPAYMHLPVVINDQGEKLSKQTLAQALDLARPTPALWQALHFLGQPAPQALKHAPSTELWSWAMENWDTRAIPRCKARYWPITGACVD